MWTVPTESVFISWTVYVLTFALVCMYTATAMRLVTSISSMVNDYNDRVGGSWFDWFWVVYECALLAIVLLTLFAVADRWKLMELAAQRYTETREMAFVPIVSDMCRVHDHVVALASVTVALTLFRMYRVIKYAYRVSHAERMVRESGGTVSAIVACALTAAFAARRSGRGHAFLNSFVLGRNAFDADENNIVFPAVTGVRVVVYCLLYAAIVSVFVQYYVLSKLYLRQIILTNDANGSVMPRSIVKHKIIHQYQ